MSITLPGVVVRVLTDLHGKPPTKRSTCVSTLLEISFADGVGVPGYVAV